MEFASDKAFLQSIKVQLCFEKLVYLCILIKRGEFKGFSFQKIFVKNNSLLFTNSL